MSETDAEAIARIEGERERTEAWLLRHAVLLLATDGVFTSSQLVDAWRARWFLGVPCDDPNCAEQPPRFLNRRSAFASVNRLLQRLERGETIGPIRSELRDAPAPASTPPRSRGQRWLRRFYFRAPDA